MKRVAAIQMASGPNVNANLIEAEKQIVRAAGAGACLVVLPENFAIMGMSEFDKVNVREAPAHGPIQDFLAQQSSRHGIWLVGGTIPLVSSDPDKVLAASLLYNERGECVARYDKLHLFDVKLQEAGEEYTESLTIEAGDRVVVVDTPCGRLGMAVCYDLRFPELFRCMLDQGMEVMALPSAFTALTGKAHWEILVRARAIENLCYVIAPAQGGFHVNGRETYGDSMIVEPWGGVLAHLRRGTGFVSAAVDLERLQILRRNFPSHAHRRLRCAMV